MQLQLPGQKHAGFILTTFFYIFAAMPTYCPTQVDIQAFNCSNHQLTDVPHGIHPGTKSLNLSHNNLEILHEDSLVDFRILESLILDFNKIYKITDRSMNAVESSLEYLSLRGNRLSFVSPSDFPMSAMAKLRRLKYLDLSENPLVTISTGWFTPLGGSLEALQLAHLVGETELLPNAFFGLGRLKQFDISNNIFRVLPEHAFSGIRPEKLARINLRDIPWHCDCNLLWLRLWLSKLHISTLPHDPPVIGPCVKPWRLRNVLLIDLPMTMFQCPPKLRAMRSSTPHYFDKKGGSVFVSPARGDSITLNCSFTSYPKMFVGWYKNGVLLRPDLKRFKQTVEPGNRFTVLLTISALRLYEDNGNYTCNCENYRGTAKGTFSLKLLQHTKDAKYHRDEAAPTISHTSPHNITSDADTPRMVFLLTAVVCLCALCVICLLVAVLLFRWRNRSKCGEIFLNSQEVEKKVDSTTPIASKSGVYELSPQVYSEPFSIGPPSMIHNGPSALKNTDTINCLSLYANQGAFLSHSSPSPHRHIGPSSPDSRMKKNTCRPIVRTFASFEAYDRDDEEEESKSKKMHPNNEEVELDEDDLDPETGRVNEECPVHGSRAKAESNFCPIHSQQSLDRQQTNRYPETQTVPTSFRRWSTMDKYWRRDRGSLAGNECIPRGYHRSNYNTIPSKDLIYTNAAVRDS